MKEKDIETILRQGVKKLGGCAYKFVSPGNDGVPDRIVVMPNRAPVFVELKTEKGRLSPLQHAQIKKLQGMGQDVFVLRGVHDVRWFLDELTAKG